MTSRREAAGMTINRAGFPARYAKPLAGFVVGAIGVFFGVKQARFDPCGDDVAALFFRLGWCVFDDNPPCCSGFPCFGSG